MCQFLAFVSTWEDGQGVQVYSTPRLREHSEAVQLWNLPPDVRRWAWERDGADNLILSHGQNMTPEREAERLEILRLWPTRDELVLYLLGKLVAADKVGGDLNLGGCPIKVLPEGLNVGGNLYLDGCPIKVLPEGLNVGGNLYLCGCPIKVLPEGLKVGGYLYLGGCPDGITIPKHLQKKAIW